MNLPNYHHFSESIDWSQVNDDRRFVKFTTVGEVVSDPMNADVKHVVEIHGLVDDLGNMIITDKIVKKKDV